MLLEMKRNHANVLFCIYFKLNFQVSLYLRTKSHVDDAERRRVAQGKISRAPRVHILPCELRAIRPVER